MVKSCSGNTYSLFEKSFVAVMSLLSEPLMDGDRYKEIALSDSFERAWGYSLWQYIKNKNNSFIVNIINGFGVDDIGLFLTGYACERFGLSSGVGKDGMVFLERKRRRVPNLKISFSDSLRRFKAVGMNINRYKGGRYSSIENINGHVAKASNRNGKIDLLDSYRIYSGSFGSGRRR